MYNTLTALRSFIARPARLLMLLACLLCGATSLSAQTLMDITGTVTDADGEPVIGATVRVKGTDTAAATNIDGEYFIKAKQGDVITVNYIGCKTAEAKVTSNKLDFVLESDSEVLDEVVVVGYGVVKKKDLTGSVANLKGEKAAERRTTQLSSALQGAIAGVQVSRSNGQPGAGASDIIIRGVTTMGDSSPLIIVDGVPVDNINDVNAQDVQDISILKDAASAAIYGSRAAAGVVLITTKRAQQDKMSVTYNFEYGLEIPTSQPKQVAFQRYLEMVNELRYNDNPAGGWYQEYSQDQVENWVSRNATDPDNYPMTDWYDLMVKGSAPRQSHVVNLTGGSERIKTRATLAYDKINGLFKDATNSYERIMARVNNDFKFNKYLAASVDLNVNYNEAHRPEFSSVWTAIFNYSPAWAPTWENGGMGDVKSGSNPYGRLVYGGWDRTRTTKVGGKASIDITPIDGLKIQGVVAPNLTYKTPKTFTQAVGYNAPEDPNTIIGYLADHEYTSLTEERTFARSITWQAIASYIKSFGRHEINLMAGYESYFYHHDTTEASTSHFELNYPYLTAGNREYDKVKGSAYENAYQSYFGRAMYNYADRYLLQFNIRRDASSRFNSAYRWGTFPSVSAGWAISKENFMKDIDPRSLSYLKLRGSWGRLGNERIGNYPFVADMQFSKTLFYDGITADKVYNQGAYQKGYPIDNITWETTESWDVGLDARFLNSRLGFTADYYRKNTKDMLLDLDIPKYVGVPTAETPSQNAGKMETTGYDLELSWNDRIGNVTYSVAVNFSDYLSKMTDMRGTRSTWSSGTKVAADGTYYQEWYGYIAEGLFQTNDDLQQSAKISDTTTLGDIKYRDIDGDGSITPENDRVYLGNSLPRYLYGGTISAQWNGFDFSAAFQGVGSQKVRMTEAMVQPFKNNWGSIPGILDGNYWSENNTQEQNLSASYPRLTYVNRDSNNAMSTFWMFNGRYFRMKNITLGYTLPQHITRHVFIDRLRLYVSANDLFCIHNYPTGYDPERTTSSYPITKSVLFGLNVNF